MKISKIKLFSAMARKKINIKLLSELSGVTRQTILAINNGKSCNSVTAGKIADALGVDVAELLEEWGNV